MKLWLCKTTSPSCYFRLWVAVANDQDTVKLYHPDGTLKWDGTAWRYLPDKAPAYDARYCRLEADGSFDPYKVGTLYYDQTKHFRDGPAEVTVLRCLGEAAPDLKEGVAVTSALGVERTFYVKEDGTST